MRYLVFLILTLTVTVHGYSQRYNYIKIYTVQAGLEDKDKAKFVFPDYPDSAKIFTSLKLPDILLGIELMEKKGFELVDITTSMNSVGMGGVAVNVAVMRRKLGK